MSITGSVPSFGAVLLLVASVTALAQDSPSVKISVPTEVSCEQLQIIYFMRGPFGGYGGHVEQKQNMTHYIINADVGGKNADEIKIVAYAPGCDFQKFEYALAPSTAIQTAFNCNKLPTMLLKGRIQRYSPPPEVSGEVTVYYMASWTHDFFGIKDGMVTQIPVARAVPNKDGAFEMKLPDFTASSHTPDVVNDGSFCLLLGDAETGNPIARQLVPKDYATVTGELQVRLLYTEIEFDPRFE